MFPYAIVRAELELSGLRGVGGSPLQMVEHDGLALVGSPSGEPPPVTAPEAFMDVVSDIASRADGACVPMRASDSAMNQRDAASFLRTGRDRFVRLLGRLEGREEWSVLLPGESRDVPRPALGGTGRGYLEERRRDLTLEDGVKPSQLDALFDAQRVLAPRVEQHRVIGREGGPSIAVLIRPEEATALERLAERESWGLCGPYPAFSFVTLRG